MQFWIENIIFKKFYSIFKLEENSQDDLNSVVHKTDT